MKTKKSSFAAALLVASGLFSSAAMAQYNWASSDVGAAWKQGYTGRGTTITVVDQYSGGSLISGNLGFGRLPLTHGMWTSTEASLIAPAASVVRQDFNSSAPVRLSPNGLNVLNLSYGVYASAGYSNSQIGWDGLQSSIISNAQNGAAVIAKAAGNSSTLEGGVNKWVSVDGANSAGKVDYLNLALKNAPSAIFVGALNTNGSPTQKATLASYSNTAGTDVDVQKQYLVVGVEGQKTGLYGTSFAAPIISGYAAILGSKFKTATSTQIANQLLSTARKDTIADYSAVKYGQGEASLSRALAPVAIR